MACERSVRVDLAGVGKAAPDGAAGAVGGTRGDLELTGREDRALEGVGSGHQDRGLLGGHVSWARSPTGPAGLRDVVVLKSRASEKMVNTVSKCDSSVR